MSVAVVESMLVGSLVDLSTVDVSTSNSLRTLVPIFVPTVVLSLVLRVLAVAVVVMCSSVHHTRQIVELW